MAVTLKDIAERAGVSTVTVSKVLRGGKHHISAATQESILRIAGELGYVPNHAAQMLKTRRSHQIGYLLPDIANPFFADIARGLDDEAKKHGYNVLMYNTDNDPSGEQEAYLGLSSRMVDGIVFVHSLVNDEINIPSIRVPTVFVDRTIRSMDVWKSGNAPIGQIFVDACKAFFDSTELLIGRGCVRPAFISAQYRQHDLRMEGYLNALETHGITADERLIYCGKYDVDTGINGIRHILSMAPDVDGVVCGDDLIAIGVLEELDRNGRKVPGDVRVIGFDDIYFAKYCRPKLTTVAQPSYMMGAEAVAMLISHIENGSPLYRKQLDCALKIRETV